PRGVSLLPDGELLVADWTALGGQGAVIRLSPAGGQGLWSQTVVSSGGSFAAPHGAVGYPFTAPTAIPGALSATEDTQASGKLSGSDPQGLPLTYSVASQGGKGTVTITDASTGAFTYTPNANANGPDSFTFQVSDGAFTSAAAAVTVSIAAVNDAPV